MTLKELFKQDPKDPKVRAFYERFSLINKDHEKAHYLTKTEAGNLEVYFVTRKFGPQRWSLNDSVSSEKYAVKLLEDKYTIFLQINDRVIHDPHDMLRNFLAGLK